MRAKTREVQQACSSHEHTGLTGGDLLRIPMVISASLPTHIQSVLLDECDAPHCTGLTRPRRVLNSPHTADL